MPQLNECPPIVFDTIWPPQPWFGNDLVRSRRCGSTLRAPGWPKPDIQVLLRSPRLDVSRAVLGNVA
jgi:hypothetical protein